MIEYKVNINGIDVDARFSEANRDQIFLPLLRKLTQMQREKGKRLLVMLAAPPGAGKSTLCSFLEQLSVGFSGDSAALASGHSGFAHSGDSATLASDNSGSALSGDSAALASDNSGTDLSDLLSAGAEDIKPIQVIGMDGFHMKQDYLLSHTAQRDGKEVRMVDIKGAPVTFEIGAFLEMVKKVASGENCGWPIYDRHLHNPVDNAIRVEKDIVLLEGNYLLLEEEGWTELSNYADYTISLRADEKMLSERLVARRLESGHPEKESREFVEFSDMYNARICLQKSKRADLNLNLREDGECEVI